MVGTLLTCTVLSLLALLLLWPRRPKPEIPQEASVTWRLALPRAARFSVSQAAAWFASLAPLLAPQGPHPSVELRNEAGEAGLRLTIPASWEATVRSQVSAWFPDARLEPVAEPDLSAADGVSVTLPLQLAKADVLPVLVPDARSPDPLLGLFGLLSGHDGDAEVRLTWGPAPRHWRRWAPLAVEALKAGKNPPPRGALLGLTLLLRLIRQASVPAKTTSRSPAITPEVQKANEKARNPVFTVRIQVWARASSEAAAARRAQGLADYLQVVFRDSTGNALAAPGASDDSLLARLFGRRSEPQAILSARELAALFHVPSPEHRLVSRHAVRVVPPVARALPAPDEMGRVTCLGEALTDEGPRPFGLGPEERRLHTYIVGKTGTGKSTLLATIARQDLEAGHGLGLIDPHGDLAERILALVPPRRAADVLYFNPADTDYPVGFNPLAAASPEERSLAASGVVGAFKKLYGEFWGPRLEYFLRNSLLALLELPSPSLLMLPRLLSDRTYRQHVLTHVRDPLLRTFFLEEYERYDPRWRAEAISPILNKIGQFLAAPVIRSVVGQSRSGFNLREVMDNGGIFIANLSTGKIGEDNSAILGGLLVAGFQIAAMRRARQPEEERRDFYLLVDEFQHFGTDAFAAILSEARKYRLCLTLSHQYLDQVPTGVLDAVLGNVGSLAVFRVGAPDATRLVRELAPPFDARDLVHLPNHHFCARINRAGETLPAFSARTIPLPGNHRDIGTVIEGSRRRWARPRPEVELEIADQWEGRTD